MLFGYDIFLERKYVVDLTLKPERTLSLEDLKAKIIGTIKEQEIFWRGGNNITSLYACINKSTSVTGLFNQLSSIFNAK
ncbi:hypothetical protein AM493_13690 [Flavobacterium akiainvivens]|uniref:Uncharacterized protein n=1 Tax=Flavobacterium akiainvivens TaxID=1202724 RepID=A0A0M9VIQ4_9FLAO|nr:hypothetical protein [Flavobacterium akiainvivens]KOS06966.1 hypothetical protein AM493_13690 [Flavobacterium akiainvivens]SFQ59891.1 hypothetical protein SAMN05444144_109141 [Flavobacterium akiainvivens]